MSGSLQNFGGKGGPSKFEADIPVSLAGGKSLGKYPSGSTVPAAGRSFEAVLDDIAAESIYPTYQPAGLGLQQSLATVGEVGERLTNALVATYYRGDAGAVVQVQVFRDGQRLAVATTDTCRTSDQVERTLAGVGYVATCDYRAGQPKNVLPAGTPDDRAPIVRNGNAPQAAETNLASNQVRVVGCYRYFWGPVATVPTSSIEVRSLASSYLSQQLPGAPVLATGSQHRIYVVAVPAGVTLAAVVDASALGAVVTSQYQPRPIQVEDAAGRLTAYTLFVMQAAAPYSESHSHQLTFSA